jgi:predicted nucleic acid-binding protein
VKAFFDTNVVFYMYDERQASKQRIARTLFREMAVAGAGVLSAQVVAEFINAAVRKLKPALSSEQLSVAVNSLLPICRIDTTKGLMIAALELSARYRMPIYDAMIVQAAIDSGASILYSEDLHAGHRFGGVTVVNPFAEPSLGAHEPAAPYRTGRTRRKAVATVKQPVAARRTARGR